MKLSYTHLANFDGKLRRRRYELGDRLICYARNVEVAAGEDATAIARRLYDLHNGDDNNPQGWSFPPIGIGDVLVIGEVAVGVTHTGLEPTECDPADVISSADWIEFRFPGVAGRPVVTGARVSAAAGLSTKPPDGLRTAR